MLRYSHVDAGSHQLQLRHQLQLQHQLQTPAALRMTPSPSPPAMAPSSPLTMARAYTFACWVKLAPSGLAPLRCVARCSQDLPLCTLRDQLGSWCGRDSSLRGEVRREH